MKGYLPAQETIFEKNGAEQRCYGNPDAPFVLIQMVDDRDLAAMESQVAEIKRLTDTAFFLVAVKVRNWNTDLSPWSAPAVFGKEDFGGGAAETLRAVLDICKQQDKTCILGGYSLAGLFALWACCQTDVFRAVAAASPSLWFPGFTDYLRENRPQAASVYLSLGDREEKTRNPVMAAVGSRIRETYALLQQQGISTTLEWNPGNHFKDAHIRTAKAFAWALEQCSPCVSTVFCVGLSTV